MMHLPAAILAVVFSASVDDVAAKVQKVYGEVQDYKASFVQEVALKTIDKVEKDEGTVLFKKPGKMRWEYRKAQDQPVLQLIVTDGETIWFYTPADKQVMVDKMDKTISSKTFLSGMGNLKEEFKVKFAKDRGLVDRNKYFLIDLKPKTLSKDFPGKMLVAISKDTYRVDQAFMFDQFGNRTRIIFEKVELNTGLPDSLFSFDIPKGVEIIRPPKK